MATSGVSCCVHQFMMMGLFLRLYKLQSQSQSQSLFHREHKRSSTYHLWMAAAAAAAAASSSLPLPHFSLSFPNNKTKRSNPSSIHQQQQKIWTVHASISAQPAVAAPDDLVASILSKVRGTDRGVQLPKEGHKAVADIANELGKYCVDHPVNCPLIFGEWDVLYCSNPTSPGGGYRSALGRLIFKTNEMMQVVEAPDMIRNKVSFSALGFIDGEVSLKGKLKALDDKWIQVIFEPPELKIGSLGFQYGGESEVKLEITYVDEKIRLGQGSRGSLFVFLRK